MRPPLRDALRARTLLKKSSPKGSGAPKDANLWCPRSSSDHGGRLAARHKRRFPYCAGPRFLSAHRKDTPSISQLLAGPRSGPGRSPGAARVKVLRDRPAGHRTSSRSTTPHENAPLEGRGGWSITWTLGRGDKFGLARSARDGWRIQSLDIRCWTRWRLTETGRAQNLRSSGWERLRSKKGGA